MLLDRDGVINKISPGRYVNTPDDFELCPGAGNAIAKLNRNDFWVFVVTNQSGISQGYLSVEDLDAIHAKMHKDLALHGARVDDVVYCPHPYDGDCICRKPKVGLWFEILKRHPVALNCEGGCYMVGDMTSDIRFGHNIGALPIFLMCGLQSVSDVLHSTGSVLVALDLHWAVERIVQIEALKGED